MLTGHRTILMFYILIIITIFFPSSLLIAQNAFIKVEEGSSITLTAIGENKSYLIHIGDNNGEIIVNNGAFLSTWSPDALINFTVSGDGDISLPVDLSSFTALAKNNKIILNWVTQSEINCLGFILKRCIKGQNYWLQIANYKTHKSLIGQGNISNRTEYSFSDVYVEKNTTYIYRLAIVNFDGSILLSHPLEVTVCSNISSLPEEITLLLPYPNPFNQSIKIKYYLPNTYKVSLGVISLIGKTVKNLLLFENQVSGYYNLYWDGKDNSGVLVSSGTYIIVLKTGDFIKSKKVVLLR